MELGTTLISHIEALECPSCRNKNNSAKPHFMIRSTKRIPTAKTTTSQPSRHTTGMILHHTKQWGIDLHSVFYRIEIFQISICKNQSVSERLFIHMSIATDQPAILAFASRSLRPKPSATKDDVKVAEIIETGKVFPAHCQKKRFDRGNCYLCRLFLTTYVSP